MSQSIPSKSSVTEGRVADELAKLLPEHLQQRYDAGEVVPFGWAYEGKGNQIVFRDPHRHLKVAQVTADVFHIRFEVKPDQLDQVQVGKLHLRIGWYYLRKNSN